MHNSKLWSPSSLDNNLQKFCSTLDSNLNINFGYTEGYKKASAKKKKGEKSHFFSKFTKNFKGKKNSTNNLSINIQDVSNDKYLKLYKII